MSATMDIQSLAKLFPKPPPVLKIPGILGVHSLGKDLWTYGITQSFSNLQSLHLFRKFRNDLTGEHSQWTFCTWKRWRTSSKSANTCQNNIHSSVFFESCAAVKDLLGTTYSWSVASKDSQAEAGGTVTALETNMKRLRSLTEDRTDMNRSEEQKAEECGMIMAQYIIPNAKCCKASHQCYCIFILISI